MGEDHTGHMGSYSIGTYYNKVELVVEHRKMVLCDELYGVVKDGSWRIIEGLKDYSYLKQVRKYSSWLTWHFIHHKESMSNVSIYQTELANK